MINEAEIKQDTIIYLNALIATNFVYSCIELMEGTPIFKHSLKGKAKMFIRELENVTTKDMNEIFGLNDESLLKMMDDQERLLKLIATSTPECFPVLSKMIEKFDQAPQAIVNWLGLENEVKINK